MKRAYQAAPGPSGSVTALRERHNIAAGGNGLPEPFSKQPWSYLATAVAASVVGIGSAPIVSRDKVA